IRHPLLPHWVQSRNGVLVGRVRGLLSDLVRVAYLIGAAKIQGFLQIPGHNARKVFGSRDIWGAPKLLELAPVHHRAELILGSVQHAEGQSRPTASTRLLSVQRSLHVRV